MKPYASLKELPENYQLKVHINMKSSPRDFWIIQFGSLILLVPFIFPIVWGFFPFLNGWNLESIQPVLIYTLILQIPMIVVHEWIHGIVYKQGTDHKITYKFHGFAASASVPGIYFYLRHYLKVGLAPAVLLSILFIILTIFSTGIWQAIWYFMLAIHFASCVGDFYVSFRIRKLPQDTLIEDYGIGMRVYVHQ